MKKPVDITGPLNTTGTEYQPPNAEDSGTVLSDRGLPLRAQLLLAFVLVALVPGLLIAITLWVLEQEIPRGLLARVGGVELSVAIVLVTLMVALGVASVATGRIVRCLQRLTTAASEIAAGNWARRAPIEREDEIGRLAAALNQIAAQVEASASEAADDDQRAWAADPGHRAEPLIVALQAAELGALMAERTLPIRISEPVDITGSRYADDLDLDPEDVELWFDGLLQAAVEEVVARLGIAQAALHLVDDARHALVLKASSVGEGDADAALAIPPARFALSEGGGMVEAFESGEPRLACDPKLEGALPAGSAVEGASVHVTGPVSSRSETGGPSLDARPGGVFLPLTVAGQAVGVVTLAAGSAVPDGVARFVATEEGVAALQHIVDQIGLSLAYAQALKEARAHIGALARLLKRERQDARHTGLSHGPFTYVYDGVDVRRDLTEPVGGSGAQGAEAATAHDLVLPLGSPDEQLGSVRMKARSGRSMEAAEMALARAITDEAGEALLRAQMYERTRSRLRETELLYRCSRAIVHARTPDDILTAIVEHMEGFGGDRQGALDRAWLLIPDLRSSAPFPNLRAAAVFGADQHPDQVWSHDQLPILEQGAPVVIEDVSAAETLDGASRATLTQAFGLRAAWLLPLVVSQASGDPARLFENGGECAGWLVVGSSLQPYGFPEQEQRFVHRIADVAAIMLRHLEYLAQAARRARRAQLVGSISTRVRETLDMDLMLQTALREIGENLGISGIEVQMQRQAGAESVDGPDKTEQAL